MQTLNSIARYYHFSIDTPFEKLPKDVVKTILFGSNNTPIIMNYDDGLRSYEINRPFEGVIPNLERRYRETESSWIREEISKFVLQLTKNC